MPVDIVNIAFTFDAPVAPTGHSNIVFQDDGGSPQLKVSAYDPLFVGDTGSGGLSGNVPAPALGDAIANKFLKADGTWAPPSSGSGSTGAGYWEQRGSGSIHQWGRITTDINGGTATVNFPKTFTDASSIAVVVTTRSATDRITFVIDGSVTTLGFTISNNGSGGYADWMADGF